MWHPSLSATPQVLETDALEEVVLELPLGFSQRVSGNLAARGISTGDGIDLASSQHGDHHLIAIGDTSFRFESDD